MGSHSFTPCVQPKVIPSSTLLYFLFVRAVMFALTLHHVTVHLHLLHDVDVHLHPLHVHYLVGLFYRMFPLFATTATGDQLLLDAYKELARTRDERAKPALVFSAGRYLRLFHNKTSIF